MKIYVMKAGDFFKIGVTKNCIKSRIRTLQTGCPFKIELMFEHKTMIAYELEAKFHHTYKHLNTYGEWFKLSYSDVLNIKMEAMLSSRYHENDMVITVNGNRAKIVKINNDYDFVVRYEAFEYDIESKSISTVMLEHKDIKSFYMKQATCLKGCA